MKRSGDGQVLNFSSKNWYLKNIFYLCSHFEAQVAKLVDALLSGGSARNGMSVRL